MLELICFHRQQPPDAELQLRVGEEHIPPLENAKKYDTADELSTFHFHMWDDDAGININDMITYYEWLALESLPHENTGYHNWPLSPLIMKMCNASGIQSIRVQISKSMFLKIPNNRFFWYDRVRPMLAFMSDALNKSTYVSRNHSRHRLERLYKILEDGRGIPFLMDFSDVGKCGDDLFSTSDITTPEQSLKRTLRVPVFAMGRTKGCKFSFPIPSYLGISHAKADANSWKKYFDDVALKYPWQDKANMAVWRGSHTGRRNGPYGRKWLVEQQGTTHDKLIDAHFVLNKESQYRMQFEDFQRYKAIIDIDGNGWSGRFLRLLCMNSVVIKLTPKYFDYNMGQLREWTHYIPADPELNSSLVDAVKFVINEQNEALVKDIIHNAQEWCKRHLNHEQMAEDMQDIFASYIGMLDRYDSNWGEIWSSAPEYSSSFLYQENVY